MPEADAHHRHWTLDPSVAFLNHGSFGACPTPVLEAQDTVRARLEREPVSFFVREWQDLLDQARERLGAFLGADAEGLVFVPNATAGVNAALRSRRYRAEDELLVTDHAYNACRNVLDHVAEETGARVVVARLPFPLRHAAEAEEALFTAVSDRTRVALLDHVTSPTGLWLPLERIVPRLAERGIETVVDGAHAPGQIPLEIRSLGATWYTGNCHKWLCAPKGAAFLWTAPERRAATRPMILSHGANMPDGPRSRYQLEFDWTGTHDPSPYLAIPAAIDFLEGLLPGGLPALRDRNRALVLEARTLLLEVLGIEPPAPDDMIAHMVTLPLPDGPANPPAPLYVDPLQERLFRDHGIEVPIGPWPAPPARCLRISAQAYNRRGDYERLARALRSALTEETEGA